MASPARAHVLCVDDEPAVLEGLSLNLRRRFEVTTATSGADALVLLAKDPAVAVVISDMRMPNMNGAAFLSRARLLAPDSARILLTGQADMDSTISAVNDGQIFRYLTKPCPPPTLLAAVEAGVEQNRLVTAERVLLEETLHGSIQTLCDVLSMTNPISFGRATRIKQIVTDLANELGLRERWQVEVAAMLSQLGYITLPQETAERVQIGATLSDNEQKMIARLPTVTDQLLRHIPRLEVVRAILLNCHKAPATMDAKADPLAVSGANIVRVALDFDALETAGHTAQVAVDTMRGRTNQYDSPTLEALGLARGTAAAQEVREMRLTSLQVGMIFAEDVKMSNGAMLVARGYEVSPSFLERLQNFRFGTVKEPVRVIVTPPKV